MSDSSFVNVSAVRTCADSAGGVFTDGVERRARGREIAFTCCGRARVVSGGVEPNWSSVKNLAAWRLLSVRDASSHRHDGRCLFHATKLAEKGYTLCTVDAGVPGGPRIGTREKVMVKNVLETVVALNGEPDTHRRASIQPCNEQLGPPAEKSRRQTVHAVQCSQIKDGNETAEPLRYLT
ncbi:hypothetical protein MRX96_026975 [Rhipicephalus microplus]